MFWVKCQRTDVLLYVILTLKRIRMLKIGDAYEWCYTVVCPFPIGQLRHIFIVLLVLNLYSVLQMGLCPVVQMGLCPVVRAI